MVDLKSTASALVGSSPAEGTNYLLQGGTFKIIYNPITGKVNVPTWLSGKYRKEGRGYVTFKCNGKLIKVHRYAFYYMTGKWPTKLIDHIDENTTNNAWNNLEEKSSSANQLRSSTKRRNNTSGYIGVYKHSTNNSWFYSIQIEYSTTRKYGIKCPTAAAIERDKYIIRSKIDAPLNILKNNENRNRI